MADAPIDFSLLLRQSLKGTAIRAPIPSDQQSLLDGVPYRAFRQSEDLCSRRREGTFFSGKELAREVACLLRAKLPIDALILDPTCGLGDLLLAYAEELPILPTLKETLDWWGQRVAGIERRADLVQMTKIRLIALARSRGNFRAPVKNIGTYFPLIVVGDMFDLSTLLRKADGFLFNPPFGCTSDHDVTEWSSGQINAAALFLDALMKTKRRNAPIAAVLPEVLRCGTRYARFRLRLRDAGYGGLFNSMGRFDPWTDVDVFTTLLERDVNCGIWQSGSQTLKKKTVGDQFDVRIGPVVPHRNANKGPWRRFACAKTVPPWVLDHEPKKKRRFEGPTFAAPFVVVRRTSSPSDKKRAVGTVIVGKNSIAVENHLIVLIPKDGQLKSCKELLACLARNETSDYLNREIRCRHLTTTIVKSIPWIQAHA